MGIFSSVGDVIGKGMDFARGVAASMSSYLGGGSDVGKGMLSSLGQFGMDTVSGLFGASTQLKNQKKLIDYANAYNHPVEQMKRLAEAGLNPNLVYMNGAANLGSATGSATSPKVGTFDLLQAYNLENQAQLLRAQADESVSRVGLNAKTASHLDAQTDKLNAETQNLRNYLTGRGRSTYDTTIVKNIKEAVNTGKKVLDFVGPIYKKHKLAEGIGLKYDQKSKLFRKDGRYYDYNPTTEQFYLTNY